MPLYQCLVPAGSLDTHTRAALAEAITTVHASVIGAPRGVVNVVFTEYEPTAWYTGGRPNTQSVISATIRVGWDSATRGELLTRLSASWSSITGQKAHQTMLYLDEINPTSAMEAGMLMPAAGDEAIWARQYDREVAEQRLLD